MTVAVAGWRRSHLPHTDVSLLQRATASFTVDGFLKALSFLTLYDTDILGAIPFSGSPVSLFKSSNERLGEKKQVHDFCVRGNNSTRGRRWCHAAASDHYILCQPYFIL